ncbi:UNKNOWN [Stylonychia lemnae]|uniref:Uncharacterized protein n=1 Tax=Stylonychia lemnae TaxID=5949 RepID=A0A078B656_STYLE|nr:UNKNOWN [Stylonychia lemnae]|eukprot:CDW90000.1 UNKNOWN [Stylonychia lemnae]
MNSNYNQRPQTSAPAFTLARNSENSIPDQSPQGEHSFDINQKYLSREEKISSYQSNFHPYLSKEISPMSGNNLANNQHWAQNNNQLGGLGSVSTYGMDILSSEKKQNRSRRKSKQKRQSDQFNQFSSSHAGHRSSSDAIGGQTGTYTQEIENILNQKEQELQQVNQLRIQTLENIIEEKMRIIESLEKQTGPSVGANTVIGNVGGIGSSLLVQSPMHQNQINSTGQLLQATRQNTPNLGFNKFSQNSGNVLSGGSAIEASSSNHLHHYLNHNIDEQPYLNQQLSKYKQRALKYKGLYNSVKNALQAEQINSNNYLQQYEEQRIKNQELEIRVSSVQLKIEQEIKRVKQECQSLIKKQEQDFNEERVQMQNQVQIKCLEVEQKQQIINEYRNDQQKAKEFQGLREEMIHKLQQKNSDIRLLELEIQRLITDNNSIQQSNEDLINEMEHLRQSSMEHLENMERELQQKYDQAQNGEQELRDLQEQFLEFREAKKLKENDLKLQLDKYKHDVDVINRDKSLEIQHLKLVSETERLNLKSEFEVRQEILSKENSYLIEERKKLKSDIKEWQSKFEAEFKLYKHETDLLRNELLKVKREELNKNKLQEEIDNLKQVKAQQKAQLEKMMLDNQSLQRQLQMAKNAINNQGNFQQNTILNTQNSNNQIDNNSFIQGENPNQKSFIITDVQQQYSDRRHHSQRSAHLQKQDQTQIITENDLPLQISPNHPQLTQISGNLTPRERQTTQTHHKVFSDQINSINFQKEYFAMKEDNTNYKIQVYDLQQQVQILDSKLQELEHKRNELANHNKQRRKDLDELEKKYNDGVIKNKDLENQITELNHFQKQLSHDIESKDREISYLQDKINKLNDPITVKYEKDGLVQTYKKRVAEMEEYIQLLETKIAELKAQQFEVTLKQQNAKENHNYSQMGGGAKMQSQGSNDQGNLKRLSVQSRDNQQTSFSNANTQEYYHYNNDNHNSNSYGKINQHKQTLQSSFKDKIASMKMQLNL